MDRTGISNSIENLEGKVWSDPPLTEQTHLVVECHRLRKKPIGEFTPEDFRTMILQQIGETYLVPLVIENLVEAPLLSGDCYPGDVLCAVLKLPREFWEQNPTLLAKARGIVQGVPKSDFVDEYVLSFQERTTGL